MQDLYKYASCYPYNAIGHYVKYEIFMRLRKFKANSGYQGLIKLDAGFI
jgi:hypothetical protein